MDLESIWYEMAPYAYVFTGAYSASTDSRLATVSGILLVVAAVVIIRMRWSYRRSRVI